MDPITLSVVLVAVMTGASEALGGQLLSGLASLIKRPWHRKAASPEQPALPSGETELAALEAAPGDQQKALQLAKVLLARSGADAEFGQGLQNWWVQAEPLRNSSGNVTMTISGGNQYGPVLQGRDFSNLNFGVPPPPVLPKDPGAS